MNYAQVKQMQSSVQTVSTIEWLIQRILFRHHMNRFLVNSNW
jgi:hypothetical protein